MGRPVEEIREDIDELMEMHCETLDELKEELEEALKLEQYDNTAKEMYLAYDSFVKAGFTKEQAFELFKLIISKTLK